MLKEQDGIIRCISSKQFHEEESISIHTQVYREYQKYILGDMLKDLSNVVTHLNGYYTVELVKTSNTKIKEDTVHKNGKFGKPTQAITGLDLYIKDPSGSRVRVIHDFSMHKFQPFKSDGTIGFFSLAFLNTVPDCLYRSGKDYSLGLYGKPAIDLEDKAAFQQMCLAALITRQLLKTPDMNAEELELIVRDNLKKLIGQELHKNVKIDTVLFKRGPFSAQLKGNLSDIKNAKECFLDNTRPLLPVSETGKKEILEMIKFENFKGLVLAEDIYDSKGNKIFSKGHELTSPNEIMKLSTAGIEFISIYNYYKRDDKHNLEITEIPEGTILDSNIFRAIQSASREFINKALETGRTPEYLKLREPYKIVYDYQHNLANIKSKFLANQKEDDPIMICIPQGAAVNGKFYLREKAGFDTSGMISHEEFLMLASIAHASSKYELFNVPEIDEDFKNKIVSPIQRIRSTLLNQLSRPSTSTNFRTKLDGPDDQVITAVRALIHRAWDPVTKMYEFINSENILKGTAMSDKVTSPAKFKSMKARQTSFKQANVLSIYSTPPSNKIGLVRSLCKNVIVGKDDIMIAVYRVVNGHIDRSNIIEMNRTDIINKALAFTGTFEMIRHSEKNYEIVDKYVKVVKNINGVYSIYEVEKSKIEYVTVSAESMLSTREACIPLMSKSDGARMVYAAAMMAQTVRLTHSEVPYVMTDEWRRIIETDTEMWYKEATKDIKVSRKGNKEISAIEPNDQFIDAMAAERFEVIDAQDEMISTGIVPKRLRFSDEQILKKGEMIYDTIDTKDGYLSNGRNVLVAFIPMEGYNADDSIIVSEKLASEFTSHYTESVKSQKPETLENRMILRTKRNSKASFPSTIGYCIHHHIDSNSRTRFTTNTYKYSKLDVLRSGDKLVGRHGNKSTISRISKNADMVMLTNNIPIDIAFNTIGLYPRMNLGAVMDSQLGLVGWLLDVRFSTNSLSGITQEEIQELLRFVYNLSQTDNPEEAINQTYKIQLPNLIKEQARKRHEFIKTFRGVIDEKGKAYLKLGFDGEQTMVPVTIGVQYILKLEHISDHKQNATGMLSGFNQSTYQPDSQRTGEMELDAYDAYGATHIIEELLNIRSDNMLKHKMVAMKDCTIDNLKRIDIERNEPFATTTMRAILEAFNVYFESDKYDVITDGSADRRFEYE